jgi:hypothetical protein
MEGSTAPWADLDVDFYVEEATKVKGKVLDLCAGPDGPPCRCWRPVWTSPAWTPPRRGSRVP